MLLNAKNGRLAVDCGDMDFVTFGSGPKAMVMIPGVGDGLKTVRGTALPLALMYREYAGRYRVYAFSRKNRMERGYTTRDMARDLNGAMERLGICGAHVLGVSQGGMIAQYLAIDHPLSVDKLVLAVTSAGPNDCLNAVVSGWLDMAAAGDYRGIFIDSSEKAYTERYLKKYRLLYPLLSRMSKPKDMERFVIQAESCLSHDARGELGRISCPTLVIGGDSDRIVGPDSSRDLFRLIRGSRLALYRGLGHGAYEEAKDFNKRVLDFLS